MAFNSHIEIASDIARITMAGELDAAVAPLFRSQVEQAAQAKAKRLVLMMQDLSYMSSAGLRALVYAKQKMGANVDIYMVGVQDSVQETLTMIGFRDSVILLDSYDAAQIETL
jgi:anti-anti-sigma factor